MDDTVKVPWEKDGEEFDAEKAKSYLNAIASDRDKARQERDALKDRLKAATDGKKDSTGQVKELQQENIRLKVQLKTGLSDQQIKRLVGDNEDALMEDAQLFAEEVGIELRDFTAGAGATDEGSDGGEGDEGQPKQFSANYRTPQGNSMSEHDQTDFAKLVESFDIG